MNLWVRLLQKFQQLVQRNMQKVKIAGIRIAGSIILPRFMFFITDRE
ncbi:MAG: hypothetical protein RIQ70_1567 [Bacteroidota bacterium]